MKDNRIIPDKIIKISQALGMLLIQKEYRISIVESCTGGLLSSIITDIPNSSKYFKSGFVLYSDDAKIETFGINREIIEKYSSVSMEVTKLLLNILKRRNNCDINLAVTGYLGPTGGSEKSPKGRVYLAADFRGKEIFKKFDFLPKSRWEMKLSVVLAAFDTIFKLLRGN